MPGIAVNKMLKTPKEMFTITSLSSGSSRFISSKFEAQKLTETTQNINGKDYSNS